MELKVGLGSRTSLEDTILGLFDGMRTSPDGMAALGFKGSEF